MSQETLKRLVGALIVAVVVWGVLSLASGSGRAPVPSGALADLVVALADTASLDTLRFDGAGPEPVELARSGGRWTVDGLAVDSGTVVRLLDGLAGASLGDVAAKNAANHARMGLDTDSARTLEILVDGTPRTLLIGNQGPRYGTTYVRLPDQDEVHVLETDLRSHARRALDDWRSKRIVAVDTASVVGLEVERDGERYVLERGDSTWAFADGAPADGGTVRSLLGELHVLKGDGFLAEEDSLAATPVGGRLVARGSDGATIADIELGSGTGDRWARAPGGTVVYRMASYRLDRILPPRERVEGSG
jgi:hypothetical protein